MITSFAIPPTFFTNPIVLGEAITSTGELIGAANGESTPTAAQLIDDNLTHETIQDASIRLHEQERAQQSESAAIGSALSPAATEGDVTNNNRLSQTADQIINIDVEPASSTQTKPNPFKERAQRSKGIEKETRLPQLTAATLAATPTSDQPLLLHKHLTNSLKDTHSQHAKAIADNLLQSMDNSQLLDPINNKQPLTDYANEELHGLLDNESTLEPAQESHTPKND